MSKTQNLKNAYGLIKAGEVIRCNGTDIWVDYSERDGRNYIYWYGYGSSAENLGINNLRWIMKVLCNSVDYSFTIVPVGER